jgi:hypothetical protein
MCTDVLGVSIIWLIYEITNFGHENNTSFPKNGASVQIHGVL